MNPHFSSSFPAGSDPMAIIGEPEMIPQPLECLHGTQIAPFLSKTFDLVSDPKFDPIISWSGSGRSFVVWDPMEFARIILPRNFKHNNFSSFVRQLNTYGFRKIDTDKWEFANERFLRGNRHLLKNIQRRKSNQSTNSNEYQNSSTEAEIEQLRKEKAEMMHEVIELQHEQRETRQYMETINEKLKAAEKRQKQMISFLGKVIKNPTLVSSIQEKGEQQLQLASPRTNRKFVTHQPHESNVSVDFGKGKNVLEPVSVGIDDISVKEEEIWSMGFESNAIWSDVGNYELPEFGVESSDLWNIGTSGAVNWNNDDICFDEIERQEDDRFRETGPSYQIRLESFWYIEYI